MQVFIVKFKSMSSLGKLLDKLSASKIFSKQKKIVIKPNLITNIPGYLVFKHIDYIEKLAKLYNIDSNKIKK